MFEKFYRIGNKIINPKNIDCIVEQPYGDYYLYMNGCNTMFQLNNEEGKSLLWRLDIEEIDYVD
jgi:hypothetical protein